MASASTSSGISRDEFKLFHSIDRQLYALLVVSLVRDPAESMQVIALWLWLEKQGLRNVVKAILSLPQFLVNELADEASASIPLVISSSTPATAAVLQSHIPLTRSLLETDHHPPGFILSLLLSSPLTLALDLSGIVNDICLRAMSEITSPPTPTATTNNDNAAVHPDNRTMFVTFSKGYPVYEWEVREFFGGAYGDVSVDALHMQELADPTAQPLYARIVFSTPSTIDVILNGMTKAKFTINGKHVWMRRFVPKKPKAHVPAPQPQQPPPPEPQPEPDREPLPELPASLFD